MRLRLPFVVGALVVVMVVANSAASGERETRRELRHFKSNSIEIAKHSLSTVTNILPPPSERVAVIDLTFPEKLPVLEVIAIKIQADDDLIRHLAVASVEPFVHLLG